MNKHENNGHYWPVDHKTERKKVSHIRKGDDSMSKSEVYCVIREDDKMGANESEQKLRQQLASVKNRPRFHQQQQQQQQQQHSKLIKKAYVRFDDYLDLNEENMRRSCKRLMNRLYSGPGSLSATTNLAPSNISNGQSTSSASSSSSPPPPSPLVGSQPQTTIGALSKQSSTPARGTSNQTTTGPQAQSNRKSYLRSQYERRQERQLNLMNKMQQQGFAQTSDETGRCNHNERAKNDGASNNCQKHQHDLVAKSHELSKQRFFEKLERRESMKNSNLSTQNRQHQLGLRSKQITSASENNSTRVAEQGPAKRQIQCSNVNDNEEQLMLKVYQSIASRVRNVSNNKDTLDGLSRPPELQTKALPPSCFKDDSKELTNELIGFHTPSPQLQIEPMAASCKGVANERPLIEFLQQADFKPMAQQVQENGPIGNGGTDCGGKEEALKEEATDKSAFEIKVPAGQLNSSAGSQDQVDGFISSSLLVVKQVEMVDVQCSGKGKALEPWTDFRPHTLSGRHNEEALSQLESNKMPAGEESPLVDESSTDIIGTQSNGAAASKVDNAQVNTDDCRIVQETTMEGADLQSAAADSDNQPACTGKLITSSISGTQVSQENACANHEDDEPKAISSSINAAIEETTSKLANNNKSFEKATEAAKTIETIKQQISTCSEKEEDERRLLVTVSETNRIYDHESPETERAFVEQSGRTGQDQIGEQQRAATNCKRDNATYPVRKEDAAQREHEQMTASGAADVSADECEPGDADEAASLETIITNKLAIRDALPEANGTLEQWAETNVSITRPLPQADLFSEAVCSNKSENFSQTGTHGQVNEARCKYEEIDKVKFDLELEKRQLHKERQLLENHQQEQNQFEQREQDLLDDGHQYANPSLTCCVVNSKVDRMKDNVNHDYDARKKDEEVSSSKEISCGNRAELCNYEQLIEPFEHTLKEQNKRIQVVDDCKLANGDNVKQNLSVTNPQHPLGSEEDRRSSCSSSGFGASVGVTSSSSSSSTSDSNSLREKNIVSVEQNVHRRTNLLTTILPQSHDENQLYDSIRVPRNRAVCIQTSQLSADDCDQLVGPDQAYPSKKGRPLLVENHGYATVVNRSQIARTAYSLPKQSKELDISSGQYANLAGNNKAQQIQPVEYATVRTASEEEKNRSPISAFKRHISSSSEASLSGLSYSTSSANSGGFSKLPPPVRAFDCPSANNFGPSGAAADSNDAFESAQQQRQQARKSSLLKRFGSLVSKAFTSGGAPPQSLAPMTSNINETPLNLTPPALPPKQKPLKVEPSDCAQQEHYDAGRENANDKANEQRPKSVLVTEQNHQVATQMVASASEPLVNEADLVILPTKHQVGQQQQSKQQLAPGQHNPKNSMYHRFDDRLSRRRRHSRKLKQSDTSSLTSSSSSLLYSSLTTSPDSSEGPHSGKRNRKRASSLSEELESFMSRSEVELAYYGSKITKMSQKRPNSVNKTNPLTRNRMPSRSGRIDIDCVSPAQQVDDAEQQSAAGKSTHSRSILRWFSTTYSSPAQPDQISSNLTNNGSLAIRVPASRNLSHCEISASANDQVCEQQPISGFWGFSSLIEQSHAKYSANVDELANHRSKMTTVTKQKKTRINKDEPLNKDPTSSLNIYSNVQRSPPANGHRLCRANEIELDGSDDRFDGKCQSLNLYQNLLRNYVKRRHRNTHHHGHGHNYYNRTHHRSQHHHHHHQHHHKRHSSSRHAHKSIKCGTDCGVVSQPCLTSSSSFEHLVKGCSSSGKEGLCDEKPSVWGQLIKINKSDGSQVIELQRAVGKSWGFFVARGAINNVKGIFISRMHDNIASNSLTGLLSIGDRIMAIDECPIEPDYDILRVNQMISKKNKILLRVKPFKG